MELEKLISVIAEVLDIDASTITAESRFVEDLGADSLDFLEIVMSVEDEFGIGGSPVDVRPHLVFPSGSFPDDPLFARLQVDQHHIPPVTRSGGAVMIRQPEHRQIPPGRTQRPGVEKTVDQVFGMRRQAPYRDLGSPFGVPGKIPVEIDHFYFTFHQNLR